VRIELRSSKCGLELKIFEKGNDDWSVRWQAKVAEAEREDYKYKEERKLAMIGKEKHAEEREKEREKESDRNNSFILLHFYSLSPSFSNPLFFFFLSISNFMCCLFADSLSPIFLGIERRRRRRR